MIGSSWLTTLNPSIDFFVAVSWGYKDPDWNRGTTVDFETTSTSTYLSFEISVSLADNGFKDVIEKKF